MLVTERFTYIHQPKTGGTFVAAMLGRIHEANGGSVRTDVGQTTTSVIRA